jgi:hypothetical protein
VVENNQNLALIKTCHRGRWESAPGATIAYKRLIGGIQIIFPREGRELEKMPWSITEPLLCRASRGSPYGVDS